MVAADVEGTYCNAEAALQKMEFQISAFGQMEFQISTFGQMEFQISTFGQMEFQISTFERSSANTSALGPNAFRASGETKE